MRFLLVVLVSLMAQFSRAATITWTAGSGDWGVAANWNSNAVPGPGDIALIPSGPAITVTHSSNYDTIQSVQCSQNLVLTGGTLTVTAGSSTVSGSLAVNNGSTLEASGASLTCSGSATADDGNFYVSGGGSISLPTLQNYTKECNGANWTVTGAGSILSLTGLTNITGEVCSFPTIQIEAGGQLQMPNVRTIQAGPLYFNVDGTNSLLNLGALTNCAGQDGYTVAFEASAGGSLEIPLYKGGTLVGLTLNPGGSIPTAQIEMLYALTLNGVTNNFNALTNLSSLSVTGVTMNFPALYDFDDGVASLSGGAVVTMPAVTNYNKSCNGANWDVTGSNTVLSFPVLTNITGESCSFPTIQAENGGQIKMPNVTAIQGGPLAFNADGTNSLIDLSSLLTCAGQNGYEATFEASAGGSLKMPLFKGGPLVGLTINPGGLVPTSQIQMLDSLTLSGVTNTFNALTNLSNLTATGLTLNFPALYNFDDGNVSLSSGAVVTMPEVTNYNKYCNGANWNVAGSGTVFSMAALTNITGEECSFPAIQAESGGQILMAALHNIQAGPLAFQADGTGSLINLNALAVCAGQYPYQVTFEASAGGTIQMPHMTGGPYVGVTINSGGNMPTSQIGMLFALTFNGVTNNFNGLTNLANLSMTGPINMAFPNLFDFYDGSITLAGGATATFPEVTNFNKDCSGANWSATGAGTIINFPLLTNITGQVCSFPVIQAESGGEVLLTNVRSIELGPLTIQADGTSSLVDLRKLASVSGSNSYALIFEASAGGTVNVPNLASANLTDFNFNSAGTLSPTNLSTLTDGSLNLPGGMLTLPVLRDFDGSSLNATGGGVISLPALGNYSGGTGLKASWTADGSGSEINLLGLTNFVGDLINGASTTIAAENGGQILLDNLLSIDNGSEGFLSEGAGSVINLTSLSGFVLETGQGSITATNSGAILLNTFAFLLADVAISVPPGNPVLPPALVPTSSLTLYGTPWHSYLVEERNTLIPNSPYTLLDLVALTNAFQKIANSPPPNTAYTVIDYVANPPIVQGLPAAAGSQIQLTVFGLTNGTYQLQVTTNLDPPVTWSNTGASIAMTNAFRILAPVTPPKPTGYYRAHQL